jgi:hypothetical protein
MQGRLKNFSCEKRKFDVLCALDLVEDIGGIILISSLELSKN